MAIVIVYNQTIIKIYRNEQAIFKHKQIKFCHISSL